MGVFAFFQLWKDGEGCVGTALLAEASSLGKFPDAFYRELKHDFKKGDS